MKRMLTQPPMGSQAYPGRLSSATSAYQITGSGAQLTKDQGLLHRHNIW